MTEITSIMQTAVDPPSQPNTRVPGIFSDIEQFKIDLKAAALDGAETELVFNADVRRPNGKEFVRIDTRPGRTLSVAMTETREQLAVQYSIVTPGMVADMSALGSLNYYQLYSAVNREGVHFIWPVKLQTGGASNDWLKTGLAAAEAAKVHWVRIFADLVQGRYRIMKAEGELDPPVFSEKPFNELLEMGFSDRVIASSDHPICRKLRGQV